MEGWPANVDEVRERLTGALGVSPTRYRLELCQGSRLLDDNTWPGVCPGAGMWWELSALLRPLAPSWYPVGKYVHHGKDVLRFEWADNIWRTEDLHGSIMVHYTDGSATCLCDARARGRMAQSLVEDLVHRFGFVTHTVDFTYDAFGEEFFWKEAVPPEDPSEWDVVNRPGVPVALEHRRLPANDTGSGSDSGGSNANRRCAIGRRRRHVANCTEELAMAAWGRCKVAERDCSCWQWFRKPARCLTQS